MPAYFEDNDHDLTFYPSVPYNRDSWIVKQADGSFVRNFRKGGSETYTSGGKLSSIVDPVGNTMTLTYSSNLLTTITAPGGRALTLAYNASNQVSTLAGPGGLISTYTYDGSGRLQRVEYADEPAHDGYTFTYDPAINALTTVADLSGRTLETHAYDGSGRGFTSEISGGQERYTLTFNSNQTVVTDALGHVSTYDFDTFWGQRLVTKVTGPCSSCGGGGGDTQEWAYDDKARVISHTDGNGKVTAYSYDSASNDLLSVTDPLSHSTTYTYDSLGRVLTRTDANGAVTTYTHVAAGPTSMTETVTQAQTRTTTYAYDALGRASTVTDPRGKTSTLSYNATGDLTSVADPLSHTTSFEYDALGRRTRVVDPLAHATTTTYDAKGHVLQVTDPAGKHTDFAYDAGGRRTSVTDALLRTTSYAYDAYGRLSTVTDALNGVTQYGYDAMSNLTSLTDAKSQVTTFDYDGFRRVIATHHPGGATESFTYDPAGRLATRTDRRGIVTTYFYDDVGRLTGKSYSDSTPAVTYSYDAVGRLLTAANGSDSLTWTYDLAGEMLSEASAYNSSLVAYTYDLGGNRLTLSLNGALTLGYAYDDDGRLTSITHGTKIFAFDYDAAHRRTNLTQPNGVTTAYGYDQVSRVTTLSATRTPATVTNFSYTYDDVGNRLHKNTTSYAEDYTYDPLYRLTHVVRGSTTTEDYTYDAVGNRLSSLTTPTWTYNQRNQLLSQGTTTYSYDADGNLAQKVEPGATTTFTWNAENQLTAITRNGLAFPLFLYDPLGRRINKGDGGNYQVRYTYDHEDILIENRNPNSVQLWIHGPGIDEPLANENQLTGTIGYWHADALGSIVRGTTTSGAVVTYPNYDAFGRGGPSTGYAFTGREFDSESGLLYYRSRYYDPKAGRFLGEDPLSVTARTVLELNAYAYVANNPVLFTDPYGLNIYGNWCGPGGSGKTVDATDACCQAHDDCYGKGGADWKNKVFGTGGPQKQQCIANCDKEVCECLRKVSPKNDEERKGRSKVMWFFKCGSPEPPSPSPSAPPSKKNSPSPRPSGR